jgi:hypothetical protein
MGLEKSREEDEKEQSMKTLTLTLSSHSASSQKGVSTRQCLFSAGTKSSHLYTYHSYKRTYIEYAEREGGLERRIYVRRTYAMYVYVY